MNCLLMAMFAAQALSKQPEAGQPVLTPSRSLQWGKLNFLHTTDTHGWLAGHIKEPQYSADWGDYISFTQRMRDKADSLGVDLLVIDTGDRIEGNALYDASDPKGKYFYGIFNQQKFDILNPGNHELYSPDSVYLEVSKSIPDANGSYIASNLDYIDPQTGKKVPMARRYRVFTTKNQGIKVAAFGFIFNFEENSNNSVVQPVEDTVKEEWFQTAIQQDVDIFVVATHAPLNSTEHKVIHAAIRSQNKETPIQFFGAHTHVRNFIKYDSKSYGIQSGRYMETVGWMSIDWKQKNNTINPRALDDISFQRRYIDANVDGYQYHSGLDKNKFPTDHGKNVSARIYQARKDLDLNHVFGCAPKDLFLYSAKYPSNDSILSWFKREVLPDITSVPEKSNNSRITIINSSFLRFDILKSTYTRDDSFLVMPFDSKFHYIKKVPYKSVRLLLDLLNNGMFESAKVHRSIGRRSDSPLDHGLGYVTKDDGGEDGDDTIHTPIPLHFFPEYFQSQVAFPKDREPESVDLIFTDFIEPFIIGALNKVGETYDTSHSELYKDELVSELTNNWIVRNWPCEGAEISR
ncbi:Uncharacterized protein K3495_g10476 [Podosphaera aphanis]|nr:Uncharacterized protein K3495_g10476 [Podosphaera aphanis]